MKVVGRQNRFTGIAPSDKEGLQDNVAFLQSFEHRINPRKLTVLPKTIHKSGSTVTDLPMWFERVDTDVYSYGNTGNIYKRTSAGVYSKEHLASSSTGNGLAYFGEDNYLYFPQNKTIGRYGPVGHSTASWYNDFLGSEGGVPTNTNSLDLEAGSSQYAYVADTAAHSITGDLSMEIGYKPESLPATDEIVTLMAKWKEDTNARSYRFDITTKSNFFGDGSDGAKTISADTVDAPINATCSGTAGTYTLSATNTSFAAGQRIFIHQTQGTNANTIQYTSIQSYTAGTITTDDPLDISFSSTGNNKAQVQVMPQYTDVTIDAGKTWLASPWGVYNPSTEGFDANGKGGFGAFYCNGTFTYNGTLSASSNMPQTPNGRITQTPTGFNGGDNKGNVPCSGNYGQAGESPTAPAPVGPTCSTSNVANGGGGGAAYTTVTGPTYSGGGGGGHLTNGDNGVKKDYPEGIGGSSYDSYNLTTINLGAGGGPGADSGGNGSSGGPGAGGWIIFAKDIVRGTNGLIKADGAAGAPGVQNPVSPTAIGGGGGGAGGSILIKCQTANIGTNGIQAYGGTGFNPLGTSGGKGGDGSDGIIAVYYSSSFTGTAATSMTTIEDSTLSSTDGYVLRLMISSDGTATETYSWDITNEITTGVSARWAVTWDASASTANFYKNGTLLGTKTGALTAIHDNASAFSIGANVGSGGSYENFADGLIDDVRLWNDVRTASELLNHSTSVLYGTESNLISYYKFDAAATDATSTAADLTLSGSPSYSTDVLFSGVTSRADQDVTGANNGAVTGTYTLTTAINEATGHACYFVPSKDPQKSIILKIASVGTGDWTLTVHDALNREVASKTVVNATLNTGFFEFIFSTEWRPIIGATYHFHLTSSIAGGTVNVKNGETTLSNVSEQYAYHTTHYQFLVDDPYHPAIQATNFLAIGNERYLAKWEGLTSATYNPHKLSFPKGYRIRALALWREYLAIGIWLGSSITDHDIGYVFFWDMASDTYQFSLPIPEGGVNALLGAKDGLYIWAGYNGKVLKYTGDSAEIIHTVPQIEPDEYMEIAPGGVTTWRSLIHYGVGLGGDTASVQKGVYSWGKLDSKYNDSLSFDYPTSLGEQTGTEVKIGGVKSSGQNLFIGWQNQNTFGIDEVSPTNDPFGVAKVRLLRTDFGDMPREKIPNVARVDFLPLNSGESVITKYKMNREDNWRTGETEDTSQAMDSRTSINEETKEIQLEIEARTTTTTAPSIIGIALESDRAERTRNV